MGPETVKAKKYIKVAEYDLNVDNGGLPPLRY
jgi:hypothetical protein